MRKKPKKKQTDKWKKSRKWSVYLYRGTTTKPEQIFNFSFRYTNLRGTVREMNEQLVNLREEVIWRYEYYFYFFIFFTKSKYVNNVYLSLFSVDDLGIKNERQN